MNTDRHGWQDDIGKGVVAQPLGASGCVRDPGHNRNVLPLEDETFQVIGCAMEVLNSLGHGLNEKHYERALTVEFKLRDVPFRQQERFPVCYKGVVVGAFVPDLLAFDHIVVEVKAVDRITDHERGQVLNYLRITGLRLGLLLNFKHARLEWERVIL